MMAEKAIASNNYHTYLLMMDMSKAFDTVNRSTLMKDLVLILEPDELHLIKILVTEVQLVVKCGKTLGKCFQTNTGVPQTDCLSPILFILYLANALQEEPVYEQPKKVAKTGKHVYIEQTKIVIEAQYADDISWLTNGDYTIIEGIKVKVKTQLEKRGLIINTEKTEEHKISYKPLPKKNEVVKKEDWSWQSCKYLGSLVDSQADLKRRKSLTIVSMRKLDDIWKSKDTTIATKLRIFNSLVAPILLYNSEILTVTDKMRTKLIVSKEKCSGG